MAPSWPRLAPRSLQGWPEEGTRWLQGGRALDPLSSSYSSFWLFLAPPCFSWLLFLAPPDSAWHLRLTRYVLRCCKFTPAFYIDLNNHCQLIHCRTSTVNLYPTPLMALQKPPRWFPGTPRSLWPASPLYVLGKLCPKMAQDSPRWP